MNTAKTLEELIVEINAQREKLASAVSASSDARSNETAARNRLSDLQKAFDERIGAFKKDSRDHDSLWPQLDREQARSRHRVPALNRDEEVPEEETLITEEPQTVTRRADIEIDSRNGATKRR